MDSSMIKTLITPGDKALITTDGWFIAPDGEQYRSAFGTVKGVYDSYNTLGVKTNAKSTNWYVVIGNMTIAGCQIHYAIKTDKVSYEPPHCSIEHEGVRRYERIRITNIYDADNK